MTITSQVLMGRTGPLDNLSKERPPGSLVTGPTLASILAQVDSGQTNINVILLLPRLCFASSANLDR